MLFGSVNTDPEFLLKGPHIYLSVMGPPLSLRRPCSSVAALGVGDVGDRPRPRDSKGLAL